MKHFSDYRCMVGNITILSGVLALACMVVGAMAVEYNFDAFSNPALVLGYARNHRLAELFLYLDLFGYYLLLLPVIFYFHKQYKYSSPWTTLFTFSGLAYVLTGAMGAAILAVLWPDFMQQYLLPGNEKNLVLLQMFTSITTLVTQGLWNVLEVLFAAVWWMGIGSILYREKQFAGILTIATGLFPLLDAAGNIAGWPLLAETGLNFYLLLGIAWPVYIGIVIRRKATGCNAIVPNMRTKEQLKEEALLL